ncbi:hypothetical protein RSAG8_02496, partial [Rhizoctonia solani AG-8 WAC10335]
MGPTSGYPTPPNSSPVRPRGDSRWQPYCSRARSLTPTSGLRSSRSTESISSTSSSNKSWSQFAPKSRYPYTAYDAASYAYHYTSPPDRTQIGSNFYITPDPSPLPARYSHKASYPVPPTIDEELTAHSYRSALPPTPPRATSRASVGSQGISPISPCSIDAPHARRAFVQQLYDTLMSIYYQPNSPSSAPKVYMPVPGSLPVDPTTLHWFATELVRRASVPGVVLKLALSYMVRARSAALRACEAQVPTPISPPPSPPSRASRSAPDAPGRARVVTKVLD